MAKIIVGKVGRENVSLDVSVLLTTRLLVQADSGGGKTFLLRRLAERLEGLVQVIIIDPEGEFASLREKFRYVLAGKGGDTPADVRSAALLAQRLLKMRVSAICDIYEMKPSQRHAWVKLFLDAMIDAPKDLWHPVVVIVDEAHLFCPEKGKGESEASESMIALCTRGRKRGFCAVFATQRLSVLNKDASGMLLNRLIGPTFESGNITRAADELGIPKGQKDRQPFMNKVKMLDPGNFFALGRAVSKELVLFKVGAVVTSHQEVGAKQSVAPPPPPENIAKLLPQLADLPKEAEEKAKTERQLRQEILELRKELKSSNVVVKQATKVDQASIDRAVAKERWHNERVLKAGDSAREAGLRVLVQIRDIAAKATTIYGMPIKLPPLPKPTGSAFKALATSHAPAPRLAVLHDPPPDGLKLRPGAKRMLSAAAMYYPNGITEGQMAAQAGVTKSSGTFSTYKSALRQNGFLVEQRGLFHATESGVAYLGEAPSSPSSTAEVLSVWQSKLRPGARRMLQVLINENGVPISYDDLGAAIQMSPGSGTFSTYLSSLRTAQLIVDVGKKLVTANKDTLFL